MYRFTPQTCLWSGVDPRLLASHSLLVDLIADLGEIRLALMAQFRLFLPLIHDDEVFGLWKRVLDYLWWRSWWHETTLRLLQLLLLLLLLLHLLEGELFDISWHASRSLRLVDRQYGHCHYIMVELLVSKGREILRDRVIDRSIINCSCSGGADLVDSAFLPRGHRGC